MTTKVIVEAHCASTKEVQIHVSGVLEATLQNGEKNTVYAYDARVIEVKEVEKAQ